MNPLVDEIDIIAKLDPGRTAVHSFNRVMTYGELSHYIRSTESWLMNDGLRKWQVGDIEMISMNAPSQSNIVMVACDDPFDFLICFLAAIDVADFVLPVPPRVNSATRRAMIKKLHVSKVLHHPMEGTREIRRPDHVTGSVLDVTSGSYGARKLVVRSMENLTDEARSVAQHLGLAMGKRVFVSSPLGHSFGGAMARSVLISGATLEVPTSDTIYRKVEETWASITSSDIVTGVPYLFRLVANRAKDSGWPKLGGPDAHCYAGGEVLPESLAAEWYHLTHGVPLFQEYGLGEGGIVTFASRDDPAQSIGRPIPRVRVEIQDDELVVYRLWAPKRYYGSQAVHDTFKEDGGIRTGDLGYEKDGSYYLTGRKKSVIIVAGMKVVPMEVEKVINGVPDIEESVVVGRKDEVRGEVPVAFVTIKPSAHGHLNHTWIRRYLVAYLESYKVPHEYDYHILTEFPRTPSGKIDRIAVAKLIGEQP